MLSQTTEYALRAVVYLASHRDEPQSIEQIGEVIKVHGTGTYLSKIMQGLRKKGLVYSQRGSGGGFVLAIPPEELTVLDVVQAVDPIHRITECPLGIKDHINLCPLHRRLDHAISLLEKALRESTIAELLTEPEKSKGIPIPLCSWPADDSSVGEKRGQAPFS